MEVKEADRLMHKLFELREHHPQQRATLQRAHIRVRTTLHYFLPYSLLLSSTFELHLLHSDFHGLYLLLSTCIYLVVFIVGALLAFVYFIVFFAMVSSSMLVICALFCALLTCPVRFRSVAVSWCVPS